jgi:hypothetical protein
MVSSGTIRQHVFNGLANPVDKILERRRFVNVSLGPNERDAVTVSRVVR